MTCLLVNGNGGRFLSSPDLAYILYISCVYIHIYIHYICIYIYISSLCIYIYLKAVYLLKAYFCRFLLAFDHDLFKIPF